MGQFSFAWASSQLGSSSAETSTIVMSAFLGALLYLLGLVLFWLVCTVLFGLLTGLVSLGGSLVCLGIASAFCTALWLLSGASCSLFTCTSLTLVLGLGGLDNVVYKEN